MAALPAEICEAPIAVVNLIAADRQFFKAEVGLGMRGTLLEEDFLIVPDATQKSPRILDYDARTLSPLQQKALSVLGRQVMARMNLPLSAASTLRT